MHCLYINIISSVFLLLYYVMRALRAEGEKRPGTPRALPARSLEHGVPSESVRLNTRMPADVHVIPACQHGFAASTDFPLFVVHGQRCRRTHPPVCSTPARGTSLMGLTLKHTIRVYGVIPTKILCKLPNLESSWIQ